MVLGLVLLLLLPRRLLLLLQTLLALRPLQSAWGAFMRGVACKTALSTGLTV